MGVVLPWAQIDPVHPSLQTQVKTLPPPMQVPPFRHGPDSHELFMAKKKEREIVRKIQTKWVQHWGVLVSISPVLQVLPPQPEGHTHRNESPWSWHVPPLAHVLESHWLSPVTKSPLWVQARTVRCLKWKYIYTFTYVSYTSFLSSCQCSDSRNHSTDRYKNLHLDKGHRYTHSPLRENITRFKIYKITYRTL